MSSPLVRECLRHSNVRRSEVIPVSIVDTADAPKAKKARINEAKSIAYYSEGVSAWYAFRLEQDKTLITISVGGIGLTGTIVSTISDPNGSTLLLFGASGVFLILCCTLTVLSFRESSNLIEEEIADQSSSKEAVEKKLIVLDQWSRISLLIAAILFFAASTWTGLSRVRAAAKSAEKPTKENTIMAEKVTIIDRSQPEIGPGIHPTFPIHETTIGIGKLKPAPVEGDKPTKNTPPPTTKKPGVKK